MKKLFLVLAIAMMAIPSFAQDYTRGSGFFVRPDVYGGFFANVGYQISPYVQVSVGPGALFLINNPGNNVSIDFVGTVHGGVRVYTGKNPWTGFVDYHVGAFRYNRDPIWRHSLVGGASYKDLDFGAGLQINFGPNSQVVGYGPVITVGYNFRFYRH
jgi:hypothetical protein